MLQFTYAEVPTHMMLSIGGIHQNGIQHHAPADDAYIYPVTFLCYCMFLFYKFQLTLYYNCHKFPLMIYTFSFMDTAWCLTLYDNPIYCWALSMYNYFN